MNTKILTIGFAILMVTLVTATVAFLFPYQPDQPPQVEEKGSSQEGIQEVVNANNKFAFELYSELSNAEERKNSFYSPYSISAALAMTYEGAKGKTADEMKAVFHFPENNILRPNFASIYNNLNKESNSYQLKTGNALWVQKGYPFLEEYTSRVEKYYGGKTASLDFDKETEKSRQTINGFIEEQTNNKIKNLIQPGILNSMTKLVLTNAIYFKGTWEWEFRKADTREQDFKITPDNLVKTPMMYMRPNEASLSYMYTKDLQILELPYKGKEISMLILLPAEGLDKLESSLTAEKLNEYKKQMIETKLDAIYLPKFEFNAKYAMEDTLSAMGMQTAFSNEADFSGMDGSRNLSINKVIHQAYIKVDEEGTEAAAATAVIMKDTSSMPRLENTFRADHPFIFIIQERETGNILFLGRVTDPRV